MWLNCFGINVVCARKIFTGTILKSNKLCKVEMIDNGSNFIVYTFHSLRLTEGDFWVAKLCFHQKWIWIGRSFCILVTWCSNNTWSYCEKYQKRLPLHDAIMICLPQVIMWKWNIFLMKVNDDRGILELAPVFSGKQSMTYWRDLLLLKRANRLNQFLKNYFFLCWK